MDNEVNANITPIKRTLFDEYPDLVTVAQLQKMLRICRPVVYELIRDKKVRALKIGRCYNTIDDLTTQIGLHISRR